MDQDPIQKRGRPAKDGVAKSAAVRKRDQRERDAETIAETDPETWNDRICMTVLADSRWARHGGHLQKAAWIQLGRIRGFSKS